MQMHHGGLADAKYVAASAAVNLRWPAHVPNVCPSANVLPDGPYLTYAADVLIRYSGAL